MNAMVRLDVDLLSFTPVGTRGHALPHVQIRCLDAMNELPKLRPALAGRFAEEALRLAWDQASHDSAVTLLPATLFAQSQYEQGRIEEADDLLRYRLRAICAQGTLECALRAHVLLARISAFNGREAAALSLLSDARALAYQRKWSQLEAASISESASIHLESADIQAAQSAINSLRACVVASATAADDTQVQLQFQLGILESRLAFAREMYSKATEDLLALREIAAANPLHRLQLQLQLAVATAAIGHHSESRTLLVESLESGARQGLCMTFSDAGLAVRQLIAELAGPTPDASTLDLQPYIQALIRQFNRRNEACRNQRSGDSPPRALTQRETAILQLIARGLSNKHIARRYGITPETVKTHVKRIMLKLAAQTRAQAVARAETLGVL